MTRNFTSLGQEQQDICLHLQKAILNNCQESSLNNAVFCSLVLSDVDLLIKSALKVIYFECKSTINCLTRLPETVGIEEDLQISINFRVILFAISWKKGSLCCHQTDTPLLFWFLGNILKCQPLKTKSFYQIL